MRSRSAAQVCRGHRGSSSFLFSRRSDSRDPADLPPPWQFELQLPVAQTLALFVKVIRKLTKALQELLKDDVARTLPSEDAAAAAAARILPTPNPNLNGSGVATQLSNKAAMAQELEAEGDEVLKQLRDQQREVIDSLDLKQ